MKTATASLSIPGLGCKLGEAKESPVIDDLGAKKTSMITKGWGPVRNNTILPSVSQESPRNNGDGNSPPGGWRWGWRLINVQKIESKCLKLFLAAVSFWRKS